MFFLNEQPVDLPGCSVGLCSWQFLKNKLQGIADTCNTAEYCQRGGAAGALTSSMVILTSAFISVLSIHFRF